MTDDFRSMASKAKQAHDARVSQRETEKESEKALRKEKIEKAVDALRSEVLPILNEAVQAFSDEGVPCEIDYQFEIEEGLGGWPNVTFQCFGPEDTSKSRAFTPQSIKLHIECNGQNHVVKTSSHPILQLSNKEVGVVAVGKAKSLLRRAIHSTMESYFSHLDMIRGVPSS